MSAVDYRVMLEMVRREIEEVRKRLVRLELHEKTILEWIEHDDKQLPQQETK